MERAALSYAKAASSAVSKVPSQCLSLVEGFLISAAYLPHGRIRTPRYLPPHVVSYWSFVVVGAVCFFLDFDEEAVDGFMIKYSRRRNGLITLRGSARFCTGKCFRRLVWIQ